MTFFSSIKLCLISTLALLISACGGDSSQKDTNFVVEKSNLTIYKSTGLSELYDSNLVELEAPADAVSTDTSFVFSKTDLDDTNKAQNIVSASYTFTPQDIVFNTPITLTIMVSDTTPLQAFTIVQLVEGTW